MTSFNAPTFQALIRKGLLAYPAVLLCEQLSVQEIPGPGGFTTLLFFQGSGARVKLLYTTRLCAMHVEPC